jgi:hypothetical protein
VRYTEGRTTRQPSIVRLGHQPRCVIHLTCSNYPHFSSCWIDAGPSYGTPEQSKFFARKDAKTQAGQPSMIPQPSSTPAPTIYNYVHPRTGEHIASLLPPNHPEMLCLQQGHISETRYGLLGESGCLAFAPSFPPILSYLTPFVLEISNANLLSVGILAAVFWFPLGIGLCLLDRRVKCRRCGIMIDEGII